MLNRKIADWSDFKLFEQIYKDLEEENKKVSEEAFRKIRSACFKVMGQYPLFRSSLSSLYIRENRGLRYKTMATDGVSIHYDPDFVLNEPMDMLVWVIVHEIMHNVLKHFDRKLADIDPVLWNMACDYALNPLITVNKSDPSKPPRREDYPEGCLFPGCGQHPKDTQFENLTSEQIFRVLQKDPPKKQPPTPPTTGEQSTPDPLKVGDIVYDEDSKTYGKVKSFDEKTGEIEIDPIQKGEIRKEVKKRFDEESVSN